MTRRRGAAAGRTVRIAAGMALVLAACSATVTPTGSPSAAPATPSPGVTSPGTELPSASATVTPSPEPTLTLEPPDAADDRAVEVTVVPDVAPDGDGTILVTVRSLADARIDELVLRWPTALAETLVLAPFAPSDERIRDGGDPLVQPWTKWVVGPGEQGEPSGTTSLGWGPLLPGAALEIPIVVTRVAPGPVAFDLQVLARNDLLHLADGAPAQLRVTVP